MEVNNSSRDLLLNHFWKLLKKRDISNEAVVHFSYTHSLRIIRIWFHPDPRDGFTSRTD